MTPPTLVMANAPTGLTRNCGKDGGAPPWLAPSAASVQLILANNCEPVSGPDWPRRGNVFLILAAARQAVRCSSVKVRHRALTLPKTRRTSIWNGVRGSKPPSEQRTESAEQKRPGGWLRDGRRLKGQPVRHGQSCASKDRAYGRRAEFLIGVIWRA